MAECDSRQSELKKKCKDLRKRVQTKEQEVQETRSKIDRATKKQAEEQGFQVKKESRLCVVCFFAAVVSPHIATHSHTFPHMFVAAWKLDFWIPFSHSSDRSLDPLPLFSLQLQKDAEIEEKRLKVQQEEAEYEVLQKDLERTNKFKQYLDMVCEQNEGYFEEVDAILHRYDSLSATEALSQKKERESGEMIKREREVLAKFSKRATTEVVEKNAQMAQSRTDLETIRSLIKDRSAEAMKAVDEEFRRVKDLGSIHMAVDNLYNRCFVLGKEKQNKAKDLQEIERVKALPEQQRISDMLARLGTYYKDIHAISKEAKDHLRKEETKYVVRSVQAQKEKRKDKKEKAAAEGAAAQEVAASTAPSEAGGEGTEDGRRASVAGEGRRKSMVSEAASTARSNSRPQSGHSSKP